MSSYLAVAIPRLFLDYRISKWGKWRPSAEAKRLGALGVALETLVGREGLSWDDAYQTLLGREPGLSREAVEEVLARLPARGPRRFEGEGALEALPDPGAGPEAGAIAGEEAERKRRAHGVLAEVVAALPPQDQIVLRLRFVEEMQIADIARTLHLEARPLYRRIERLTAELRRGLAERGVGPGDFLWGSGGEERAGLGPRRPVSPGKQARSSRLDGE
jgi:RNA polymerase sigma factor for flagellar operon FliA